MAERAAEEAILSRGPISVSRVADAIERVAKEFAYRAMNKRMMGGLPDAPGKEAKMQAERDWFIEQSVAQAERGE
jgi:hypothetical protein